VSDRATATVSAVTRVWPLVGREAELEAIVAARADTACRGVVVSASAGAGKSRLADEARAAAEGQGALTYRAQATASSATIPLGALAALIPDDVRNDEPLELLRRSAEALEARAGSRPVVLEVDDAHLLDPGSAALVLHLQSSAGVFVLATVRSDALAPDAVDSLWKDAGARRIELGPLDDDSIAALIEAGLQGPVEQLVLRRVVETCAGNPLFARELVLGAIDEGQLMLDRGLWRLHGTPTISPSLAALISRRMGAVEQTQRRALELVALGEPMRLDELTGLTDLTVLEAAEAAGMVSVSAAGPRTEVRLAHPLYGELLREQLPILRGQQLRRELAETVARREPLTPDDALRIARWRLDAGEEVPSKLLIGAARAANLSGDPELGAQLARMAQDEGAGLGATLLLARANVVRNRFVDAEAVLAAVESIAPGDPEVIAYIGQRVHVLYWGLGRLPQARAFLTRAEAWSTDAEWRRRLDPWRLVLSGFVAGLDDFEREAAETERILADPGLAGRERLQVELAHAFRLMAVGRVKDAEALVRRIRPRAPLRGNYDAYALGLMSIVGLESGEDWAELETYVSTMVRDGVRAGDHESAGLGSFTLASLEMARGRLREAERWLAEADAQFERQDAFGTVLSIRALRVGIAVLRSDPAAAGAALATVRELVGDGEQLPTQIGYLTRAEGWGARALSESAGAEYFLQAAAKVDQLNLRSRLLYEAQRSGAGAAAVAGEQKRLTLRCDARLVAAYAAHAAALAARDGAALLAAADEMEAIGAHLYAMEAAADAARQFVATGRADSARRAFTRVTELYVPDQGAEMPVIDGLGAVATELTRREVQIASLAARGLSNVEIAEQLVLSVRTVETYVYRAMQKRGVGNRHEL
jgi:DNA-binding CsgD family transcriptional regulator